MVSQDRTNMTPANDAAPSGTQGPAPASEKRQKKRLKHRKLFYWLLIDTTVALIVLALLLYKPARYNPVVRAPAGSDSERVHPYLSHDLGPQLYNGAQSQRPFNFTVLDQALNEAIAQLQWPRETGGVVFSAPEVLFHPGRIVLMGTVDIEKADLVITVELEPQLDEVGLLNLNVAKVKIGAVNITPLAKMLAKREYYKRLETVPIDTDDIRTKVAASLLAGESFEPVFEVDDKWVRLKDFSISQGTLEAELIPAKQDDR
jgi:hypothetical protein